MKKILSVLLITLLLAVSLAACSETPAEGGVIVGDVLYLQHEISQLLLEPFIDALGSPLDEQGAFFFYEGLEIMSGWDYGEEPHQGVAILLVGFHPGLHLFELNGLPLNMSRSEVLAAFGEPLEYAEDGSLTYHVLSPAVDYMLTFRFENLHDNTVLTSFSIWREAE